MEFIRNIIPLIDHEKFLVEIENSKQLVRLFDLIKKNEVRDNKDAAILLFGQNGSKNAFKQLRLRLRKELTVFIAQHGIAARNMDNYSMQYRICMNQANTVKTLLMNNARDVAIQIAERLIKSTIRNEFTDLTLILSRELLNHYSGIKSDNYKARKYKKITGEMKELYNAELEASAYSSELQMAFNLSRGSLKDTMLVRAQTYVEKVSPFLNLPVVSYQLLMAVYHVILFRFEIARDYQQLIDACDKAIVEFQNRKVSRPAIQLQLGLRKIISNLQLQRNEEAESIAEYYLQRITPNTINWFVINVYYTISKLHTKSFGEAYHILDGIRSCRELGRMPMTIVQTIIVIEAYIEFLIANGTIRGNRPSQFRLNKFLNEIPLYTKDKRGLNIAILIIQVLFLLQQRKYSQIIDRAEALKQYCYRYLKKDDTFRSHCFIRMLLQMPRADFNRIRTARYAEPYLLKLRAVPLRVSEQTIEVEVIPYEDLWEMTLDLLD